MGYTRELTDEEKRFCEALGRIVIFWNHLEATMRLLVHYVARAGAGRAIAHRLDVLISNLGNVALTEALTAMADESEDSSRSHLQHCAKLFDAERVYRNHYVHTPITFHTRGEETAAFTSQTTAKGGALRLHQGSIGTCALEAFHDRISVLNFYVGALISEVTSLPDRQSLASLEKPPLPDKLELNRLRLIERKLPPQAS